MSAKSGRLAQPYLTVVVGRGFPRHGSTESLNGVEGVEWCGKCHRATVHLREWERGTKGSRVQLWAERTAVDRGAWDSGR